MPDLIKDKSIKSTEKAQQLRLDTVALEKVSLYIQRNHTNPRLKHQRY